MWELIVRETNKYYDYVLATEPNKHKEPWQHVITEEMQSFNRILIKLFFQ